MKDIMFITNHNYLGASPRFRVYQYLPLLKQDGYSFTILPFTNDKLYSLIHEKSDYHKKIFYFIERAFKRIIDLRLIKEHKIVFIHREVFPFGPLILEKFIAKRKITLLDFDDAIYLGHQNLDELPESFLYKLKYRRNYENVFKHFKGLIVGNKIIAEYCKRFNNKVFILPTAIDTEKYYPIKKKTDNNKITIGWIGSPSTLPNLKIIKNVIPEINLKYGEKVKFLFVGSNNRYFNYDNCEFRKWELDYELKALQNLDIGIMPLVDNKWNRAKCAFKAIEYMAVSIPVVASPVGISENVVIHNQVGFIARNEKEWLKYLCILIDNKELRNKMGIKGRERVEQFFSVKVNYPIFKNIIDYYLNLL